MKIYAIGDLHGCLTELKKMFEFIERHAADSDEIVCIGDYIDRGPDSKGVVDFLIEYHKSGRLKLTCLKGNHEDMMMNGEWWVYNGGDTALVSYGIDPYALGVERDFYRHLCPPEHQRFYESLVLKYRVGNVLFVHANIDPDCSLDDQNSHFMLWARALDRYDGEYPEGVTVVRGHTPIGTWREYTNHIMIDTGCVFGNELTCCIIDPETKERQFHTIKAEQVYYG